MSCHYVNPAFTNNYLNFNANNKTCANLKKRSLVLEVSALGNKGVCVNTTSGWKDISNAKVPQTQQL